MERFLLVDEEEDDSSEEQMTYEEQENVNVAQAILEREQKRRKLNQEGRKSEYIPLEWIPATSCEAERLFSLYRKVFNEFRPGMSMKTLEALLFLKINRELWDSRTVHYCTIRVQEPIDTL